MYSESTNDNSERKSVILDLHRNRLFDKEKVQGLVLLSYATLLLQNYLKQEFL